MSYPVLSTLGLKRSSQNWRLANCFIAKRGFSIQVPLELFGTILEHISWSNLAPERPLIEIPEDVWRASGRLETVCQAQLMSHARRDEPRRALSPKNAKDQIAQIENSWASYGFMMLHGCQDFLDIQRAL